MNVARLAPALLLFFLLGAVHADQPFSGTIVASSRCISCCIEGYPAEYIITINNPQPYVYRIKEYWVQSISARTVNGTRFRNQNVRLGMHNSTTFFIDADLPEPTNNSFSFQACIIYNYTTDAFLEQEEQVCGRILTKTIYEKDIYFGVSICCSDNDCEYNEYCLNNYTCSPLSCGSSEYVGPNHRCVPFECIVDGDCNESSTCVGNVCAPIICDGTIVDRQCHSTISSTFFNVFDFLATNSAALGLVIFIVIFLVVLLWFVRSGGEGKKGEGEKKDKKGKKKGKKKSKKKEEEDRFVPLIELPQE